MLLFVFSPQRTRRMHRGTQKICALLS